MTSPGPNSGTYEALYVSPHDDDVLASCPGRMLSERAQGMRALVVVAFSGPSRQGPGAAGQALARLGLDVERLGFAPAPERSGFYDSYMRRTFERDPEDERVLAGLAGRLTALVLQTKARHIYLPLGADGHVDHKISLEAGLRAVHEVTGRNVFLYEERPHALLPGAIRIRLGELAVRLPPAAADIHDGASLARVAVSFSRAPFLAGERLALWERVRATGRVAASHRASAPGIRRGPWACACSRFWRRWTRRTSKACWASSRAPSRTSSSASVRASAWHETRRAMRGGSRAAPTPSATGCCCRLATRAAWSRFRYWREPRMPARDRAFPGPPSGPDPGATAC